MSSKLIHRCLNEFNGEDRDAVLRLACHAALPVALNPELLHFLRINFFLDLDPPKQLPYTVEFKFLTRLCRQIDTELYEIEPKIRDELLQELSKEYGSDRIRQIATLLWQYVEHHSPWADRVELERAQQLTALNFLDPAKAKQWLDEAQVNTGQAGGAEREWFIAMRQEIEQLPNLLDKKPAYNQDIGSVSESPATPPDLLDNEPIYNVFFCYNSRDQSQVQRIKEQLKQHGIEARTETHDLQPLQLQKIIDEISTVAVFIGSSEVTAWQNLEIETFLQESNQRSIYMVLVILPECDESLVNNISNKLNSFYSFYRVDFRQSNPDPLNRLIWGITGQRLDEKPKSKPVFERDDLIPDDRVHYYTHLRDLLATSNWKDADQETLAVMLKAAAREEEGWLNATSVRNFPCTDLSIIDRLWVKYSIGRFGFSVQQQIWQNVNKRTNVEYENFKYRDLEDFSDLVGWRRQDETNSQEVWLDYSELDFTITAPRGHLPSAANYRFEFIRVGDRRTLYFLVSRLIECGL